MTSERSFGRRLGRWLSMRQKGFADQGSRSTFPLIVDDTISCDKLSNWDLGNDA